MWTLCKLATFTEYSPLTTKLLKFEIKCSNCLRMLINLNVILLQPSYSTEELNQEMANLEGLMKDLNAITASEFEC